MSTKKPAIPESEVVILSTKAYEVWPALIQTRAGLDAEFSRQLCERLRATGTAHLTPVMVYRLTEEAKRPDGKTAPVGTMVLADGHHRHDAVTHLPRPHNNSIRAVIRDGTLEEAILAGIAANRAVIDRRLTLEDMKAAAKVMIRNPVMVCWSSNEIARRSGVSLSTVQILRADLKANEGIAIPDRFIVFGPDGRPNGKTVTSRRLAGGRPTLVRSKGCHQMSVGGQLVHLPMDQSAADETRQEILKTRDKALSAIGRTDHFVHYLKRRGMECRVADDGSGAVICDGIAIGIIARQTVLETLAAGMRVMLSSKQTTGIKAMVLVGRKGGANTGRYRNLMLESFGIECVEPQDLIQWINDRANVAREEIA